MNSLLQAIVNVSALVPVMTALVVIVAFISGLVFFIKALVAMKNGNTGGRESGPNFVVTNLIVGTVLISVGTFALMMTNTLFSSSTVSNAEEIFAYAPGTIGVINDETTRRIIIAIVRIVQFIGLIGFIRGFFLMSAYSKQAVPSLGPAITFVLAGILAMNFPRVVGMFSALFS